MEQEEYNRVIKLAEAVVQEKYPDMLKWQPTHFHGVAYTLLLEMEAYDLTLVSDEHIKELMRIDLDELKKSLEYTV
ncbi:hypothetical protein MKX47_15720 [Solibacillus sp. FSL R7-0668]|uniref:hypothetical protein n=1 Tax=Solibacillus sp. FSL R7-0668 TaxID=2921688 RepID=UPI0030F583AE